MLKYKKGLLVISKIMLRNCYNIHPNITGAKKIILLSITIITISFLSVLFYSSDNSSALTYSSNAEVGFTFNPTISLNLSGDLLINNLSPGSVSDSNVINVNVATNASQGYVLTATSGTKTTNTDLVNQTNSAYKFSSIATNASLSNLTTDNTWGYSYSEDSGTNWSNYSGLPLDNDDEGATGKQLINTINPADNRTLQFKIAARASSNQAAGTYINTINFYAVANPDPTLQPVSCPAGKICYNANSLTPVVGEMGQQTPSSSELTNGVQLWASNFSREGYGFAGWADSTTYNGLRYGPQQTINAPSDVNTNDYSLYAIWIKSAGNLQNWTGCSNLSQGEVTALKDTRDNDVYAVAKLADDKCWMIENLRLENTAQQNTSGSLAQGYNSSFIGLADPESDNFSNSTIANSLYSIDGSTDATILGDYQGYRFPRYNNFNTVNRANNTANTNVNTYSYGNYYTWHAAVADTTHYNTDNQSIETTSICPTGWRLPKGGNNQNTTNNEYLALGVALTGAQPANYSSFAFPAYLGDPEGINASNLLRSYPNNFLYSGYFYGSVADNRGKFGYYWSSTVSNNNYGSYRLYLSSSQIYPGTYGIDKRLGYTIRCMIGS